MLTMRKLLPIALTALLFAGPLTLRAEARSGDSSFQLFDGKTKKRADKRWKKSQRDLRKNTKRYNKLARKTLKRTDKQVRRQMRSWGR